MSQIQPTCYQCGEPFVKRAAPPHHRKLRYEGAAHEVFVTDMPEWHCAACKLSVTDEEGDEPLQAALRNHVGLLTPQQIKAGIKTLGITQEKFAEKIRCAPESISRWLNGAVLQSRVYDCLMRIYFQFPEVRGALEQFSATASFGETVVHAERTGKMPTAALLSYGAEIETFPVSYAVDMFFSSPRETRAGNVVRHGNNQRSLVYLKQDTWTSFIDHLYEHGSSIESNDTTTTNRLSNLDWSRIYGEVA
jgi:hypothetical protein